MGFTIVVVRYRIHLEECGLAANTINQQLAAVRRLAYEAADAGPLRLELAAGINRVKGVKQPLSGACRASAAEFVQVDCPGNKSPPFERHGRLALPVTP